ncbi:hypothetical protein A6302_01800 [Methylobrevis pamukkalensis]|uniref:Uncharacterized protein n=1 Tax=Methylobrevis pamukkalensis TaxID=1439726 RepID=A0A1E3H3H9_9HYPH|nr:hypothetical protein A6302_01800 [Methylobrevis pamukkalensis]
MGGVFTVTFGTVQGARWLRLPPLPVPPPPGGRGRRIEAAFAKPVLRFGEMLAGNVARTFIVPSPLEGEGQGEGEPQPRRPRKARP